MNVSLQFSSNIGQYGSNSGVAFCSVGIYVMVPFRTIHARGHVHVDHSGADTPITPSEPPWSWSALVLDKPAPICLKIWFISPICAKNRNHVYRVVAEALANRCHNVPMLVLYPAKVNFENKAKLRYSTIFLTPTPAVAKKVDTADVADISAYQRRKVFVQAKKAAAFLVWGAVKMAWHKVYI